jgi:hypothetical protein
LRTMMATGVNKLLLGVGAAFMAWTAYYTFMNTRQWTGSHGATAGLLLAAAIIIVALGYVMHRFLTRSSSLVFLLVVAVGLRLGWIWYVDTQPVSDFLDMYTAAQSAAVGDFSFGTSDYFTRWVYQLGFTLYEGFLLHLFGNHLLVLKLFNVLFNTGIVLLIYASATRVFGEFSGRIAALSFALYVPQIMMCSVLTNQHVSTFLFFLGVYLVIVDKGGSSKYRWVLIGVCFALANLMRPLGSAFVAAYAAFVVLYELLPPRAGSHVWRTAAKTVGVVVLYVLLQQAASWAVQASGVSPYPLSNPEPYWKFMVGANPVTTGGWSQEDTDYVLQYPLGEERNEAERRLLMERMADKPQLIDLFIRKLKIMWGAEDSAFMWSLWQQDRPRLQQLSIQGERVGYLLAAVFGFLAMLSLLFTKQQNTADDTFAMYLILLLGYAVIHIAIEIQTRYRMDILPCLFILQSYGVYRLFLLYPRLYRGKGR